MPPLPPLSIHSQQGQPNARYYGGNENVDRLELLCKEKRWRSDSLTVIESPAGLDSAKIVQEAYKRYNLSIGVGLSKVAGKVFRIGHLGNCDEVMQASALAGTEMALLSCGVKIKPGEGVGAAIEYWAETSKVIPTRCGSS